jgi:hypothetical protein
MVELHTVEAKTKLSHLTGSGRIHLGKRMVSDLGEDQLQDFGAVQGLELCLTNLEVQGVIKNHGEAIGVAKLLPRFSKERRR